MALANDKLDFATNFLTFLSFVGSLTVALRYLNPWQSYLGLAGLTGELRKMWTDYEAEDVLPRGSARVQLLRGIQCLERQVHELVFIPQASKFQPRAWCKSFYLKTLLDQARILRIGILILCEQRRRLVRDPVVSEQDLEADGVQHLEAWFCQLSTEIVGDLHLSSYDGCIIPPVATEHVRGSRQSSIRVLPNRSTSSSSNNSNDTIVTPPFDALQYHSSSDIVLIDDMRLKNASGSSVNQSRKDPSWRHLVSRSRGLLSQSFSTKTRRQRRSSSNSTSELPV